MNWLVFALLSPAVYSGSNFIDKYILTKYIKDYRGMSMFAAVMAAVFGTFFWFFSGRPQLSTHDGFLIFLSGVVTFLAQVVYFKALTLEDTSKIIVLFSMAPVITLVLSYLFLGEHISFQQFVGFVVVLFSVIGVSFDSKNFEFKLSPAFYLILLNSLLWSVGSVLFKYVIDQNSFVKVVSYESWGIAIGGLLVFMIFKDVRIPFIKTLSSVKKSAIFFIFLNEGVFVLARLLSFLAISLGPLTLVSILGSTNVFFGLIFGTVLTIIRPKVFNEDISKINLIKKAGFALLAFVGIGLIS